LVTQKFASAAAPPLTVALWLRLSGSGVVDSAVAVFDHWPWGCFVLQGVSEDPFPGIIQAGEVLGLDPSARKPPSKANTPEFRAPVRNFNHSNSRSQVGDLGSLHA
jgi:hypothetical protein